MPCSMLILAKKRPLAELTALDLCCDNLYCSQWRTQGEWVSGGSTTSVIDMNVNTEMLDLQHCQATAMSIV